MIGFEGWHTGERHGIKAGRLAHFIIGPSTVTLPGARDVPGARVTDPRCPDVREYGHQSSLTHEVVNGQRHNNFMALCVR